METIISSAIAAFAAIVACLINNNIQRTREQNQIELQIMQVKSDLEIVNVSVKNIAERMDKYSNLVDRMYVQENLAKTFNDRLERIEAKIG